MIVCNLAIVVCLMESDCSYGLATIFRVLFLTRGRTQIALITNISLAPYSSSICLD